jgi:predicted nucleotidyltransferase/uncharacterized protein (UPF0332 family)
MASLATASLSEIERRALDRFVELLKRELGPDLRAVWLFGSRARGEPRRDWSDVDLLVVTTRGPADRTRVWELAHEAGAPDGGEAPDLTPLVESPEWVDEQRAAEAFLLQEIDEDKIVLVGGEIEPPPGFSVRGIRKREPGGLMTRSREYLEQARYLLTGAKALLDSEAPGLTVAESYFAVLNAARAALSERDLFSRTHPGTWRLVRSEFVRAGLLPGEFLRWAAKLQGKREAVHYKAMRYSREEAGAAYAAAERFVEAVEQLLGA